MGQPPGARGSAYPAVRATRGNAADAELPLRGCQRVSGWAYAAILIVPADGLRLSGELPYHAATFRGCARSQLRTRLLFPCFSGNEQGIVLAKSG